MATVIENGVVASGAGVRVAAERTAIRAAVAGERGLAKTIAVSGTKHITQELLKQTGEVLTGVGGFTVIALPVAETLFAQHDHNGKKSNLAEVFKNEISAVTGKPADKVDRHDVDLMAKINPAIQQAVHKSALKRNISIVATAVAALATVAFVPAIGLAAATPHVVAFLVNAAVGTAAFLGIEKTVEAVGEKHYKTNEPSIDAVEKHPAKQAQMSVASQAAYLAHQQEHRKTITKQQVMTVFASANPSVDAAVKAHFGESFSQLSEGQKDLAVAVVGPQLNLAKVTDALNSRRLPAQELAFLVNGQASGAPRYVAGEATRNKPKQTQIDMSASVDEQPADPKKKWTARLEVQEQAAQNPAR